MIGKTISHYQILEKLGVGGMGVIYKARDLKLDRFVALKFLPPHIGADAEEKERFIHEAKAASTLDHVNICTIHEIAETDDGQLFIVMACYEGETLKNKIKDKRLKIKDTIDYATQIVEALQAAHDKGIVHRDIKPANIFITNEGVVKILDFGLAKLHGQTKITKAGTTLGTLAYMSPEQIQGHRVDARSDIFSFGVLLYEMLTGQLPFKGEYESAMIYSILNEEPKPLTKQKTGLPVALERMVTRALIKNPIERYQHAHELLLDLKTLKNTPVKIPDKQKRFLKIFRPVWGTVSLILLLMLLVSIYLYTRPDEGNVYQIKRTSPLTTSPGLEQDPSWSPEGTRLAYTSDESGNMDIWVMQIAAGQRINLTRDFTGYDGKPAWSPDGEWIAFVSERDGGGIFIMPALGGIPKRIISLSFAISLSRIGSIPYVSWSPDGSRLAYAVAGSLYTIPAAGGIPAKMPLPPTGLIAGYSEPAWSPDGSCIACTGFLAEGVATSQIWSSLPGKSDPIPVTEGKYLDHNPVWSSDGQQLFFISDRGGSFDVWWLPVNERGEPAGDAQSLTAGAGVGAIALSRNGTHMAFSKVIDRSNIWSIPIIPDRPVKLVEAMEHTSENNYIESVVISPDGDWIAFDCNRRGNMDIWIMHKNGGEVRTLTTNPAHDWCPYWSPDGKTIVFHSMRSGNRDLYMIPVGGGAITQLTSHPAEDLLPIWSPDGKKIAFLSNRAGNMDAWLMNSSGGEFRQLTFNETQDLAVAWAPDSKQIVFCTNRTGYYELFMIPETLFDVPNENRQLTQLTHGKWTIINAVYWTPDGQTIYSYGVGGPGERGANLWAVSVVDGSARPLIDFHGSSKEPSHSLSSDGKRIYFPLWERIGDLWLADLSIE
jgi:Tol biopolymer transport system component/tRNA A-37 threonylcarbamoyl transferase component Bud32